MNWQLVVAAVFAALSALWFAAGYPDYAVAYNIAAGLIGAFHREKS